LSLTVAELWRYPVKGLRGERLERLEIAADGIPGDRGLTVTDERGIVTGRRKQRMVGLPATLDEAGVPHIAGSPWDSAEAAAAVREVAGASAKISRPLGGHEFDAHPLLLVTDGAINQFGYDHRRFRPNVFVTGADGPVEQDWIGREVRIGEVLLRVVEPCERCVVTTIDPDTIEVDLDVLRRVRAEAGAVMGVYCSVVEPGIVKAGTPVQVM